MFCPGCKKITKCQVSQPDTGNRNWHKVIYSDIQWCRREHMCRTCFYHFNTAEVQEDFLNELFCLHESIISGKTVSIDDLLAYGDNIVPFPVK